MLKRIWQFIKRTNALKKADDLHTQMLRIGWRVLATDDLQLMIDWNNLMKDIEEFEDAQYVKLADGVWAIKF